MSSMYETIMELPLFKGIGEDQLSLMLEKTSVEFLKYEDGDIIAENKDIVTDLNFILSGRVRQTYDLVNFPIAIDEIVGKGSVIGALHLFGMNTTYTSTCMAMGKVSIMKIGKKQYMNIIQSDKIYMLNFVNYLSAAAQKAPALSLNSKKASINRTLESLAYSVVSRAAETVMVAGEDNIIAEFCGVSDKQYEEWKIGELAHNRILINNRGIILKSPHLLR